MKSKWIATLGLLVALSGCRTVHQPMLASGQSAAKPIASNVETIPERTATKNKPAVRQVAFQQENSSSDISTEDSTYYADSIVTPVAQSRVGVTSLAQLEQIALATNPAVSEIHAEIESLRGKLTQAGLPPNPTAGIVEATSTKTA